MVTAEKGTLEQRMGVSSGEWFESLAKIDLHALEAPAAFDILEQCIDLALFLIEKNRAYGNSAIEPVRVFSKADPLEQIRIRMDDKMSRLMRGQEAGEDCMKDLVGYWILLKVAEKKHGKR